MPAINFTTLDEYNFSLLSEADFQYLGDTDWSLFCGPSANSTPVAVAPGAGATRACVIEPPLLSHQLFSPIESEPPVALHPDAE